MDKKLSYKEMERKISDLEQQIADYQKIEGIIPEGKEEDRSILETIEDGYYDVNLEGKMIFVNKAFRSLLGYSEKELLDIDNKNFFKDSTAYTNVYKAYNKIYLSGNPEKAYEQEIVKKNGSLAIVNISISLIRSNTGKIIGFRGIIRDITAEKGLEQKLLRTTNFLEKIVDGSVDIFATANNKGKITYISPRVKEMIGYERDEVLGKASHLFYGAGKKDYSYIQKTMEVKGQIKDYELEIYKKDGGKIDINLSVSYLTNEKGDIIGTLGVSRDITEKKKMAHQIQHTQKMEAIGTLTGGIAHDFNNILQAISGYTQLLMLDKKQSDSDWEELEAIRDSTFRAKELIKRLLIFSRKEKANFTICDLNKEVMDVSKILGSTLPKMIKMDLYLSNNLKTIKADKVQLEQMLLNLGINARDAMPGGGRLILETCNVDLDDAFCKIHLGALPGRHIQITVSDTGHGMDKSIIERIFEPFFTTKEVGKGTGLGLSMVYGIVKDHGGYISCYSEADQGTTFKIYFPVHEYEELDYKSLQDSKDLGNSISGGDESILFVDDDPDILNIGQNILTSAGYSVIGAKSGEKAIDIYQKLYDRIDLVILDFNMPGMGGRQCLDRIMGINSKAKIIIISGYTEKIFVKKMLGTGVCGFIEKPFQTEDILKKIRMSLDYKARSKSLIGSSIAQ